MSKRRTKEDTGEGCPLYASRTLIYAISARYVSPAATARSPRTSITFSSDNKLWDMACCSSANLSSSGPRSSTLFTGIRVCIDSLVIWTCFASSETVSRSFSLSFVSMDLVTCQRWGVCDLSLNSFELSDRGLPGLPGHGIPVEFSWVWSGPSNCAALRLFILFRFRCGGDAGGFSLGPH